MTEAMKKVSAEPCRCITCSFCGGSGRERCGDYMGMSEPCEECGGRGIVECCDRCQLLEEMDDEQDDLRSILGDALR
jgi:hypothetical protein